MQRCLPLFLHYWVIQRKVCKISRLQILPQVKLPRSTMTMLITYWGFRKHRVHKWLLPFRVPYKGIKCPCCSQQVSAGLVWDALTAESGSPAETLCVFLFLWQVLPLKKIFLLPILLLYLSAASFITWLLAKFQTKLVQHGAKSGGWSWADTTVHSAVFSLIGEGRPLAGSISNKWADSEKPRARF